MGVLFFLKHLINLEFHFRILFIFFRDELNSILMMIIADSFSQVDRAKTSRFDFTPYLIFIGKWFVIYMPGCIYINVVS